MLRKATKNDIIYAEKLFDGWEETMIWSCLQGVMGDIYVTAEKSEEQVEVPTSAVAILGAFAFFAGVPNRELILYKPESYSGDFVIMVPQNPDWATYQKLGLGVVILSDGQLVSGASSYTTYENGIEIQVDTKNEYRRKGLAEICSAKLILMCLERGLYPSWDAQNKGSLALAEKLGYHYSHTYTAYEVYEYGKGACV